jgi:hypothetical protein
MMKYRLQVITPLGTFYSKWFENQAAVRVSEIEFEKLGNLKMPAEDGSIIRIPEGTYLNSIVIVEKSEQ